MPMQMFSNAWHRVASDFRIDAAGAARLSAVTGKVRTSPARPMCPCIYKYMLSMARSGTDCQAYMQ